MNYLQGHFERIEKRLTAEGELARSFDHSLHKGHIREAFVREFLGETISELWGVGTGEVLGSTEASSRQRQIDVVIHNRRYPKISLSAGTDLFFLETISSFVEIKSSRPPNGRPYFLQPHEGACQESSSGDWALVNQINGDQFAKRFQFTPYLGHLPLELWVDD